MNTLQWTVVIYNNEEAYLQDKDKGFSVKESRNVVTTEYYDNRPDAKQAAKVAEYQGHWVRVFNPYGEQVY